TKARKFLFGEGRAAGILPSSAGVLRMKMKTVALLVVAVVLGTVGSRFCKRLFSNTTGAHQEQENVVVLAAMQPLAAGAVLQEPDRLFEERRLAKNEAPAQAIHKLYQLRGRRLAKAIDAQAIITVDTLVDEEGATLELVKREGRQAIAIVVQPPSGQLFVPQTRVDVI